MADANGTALVSHAHSFVPAWRVERISYVSLSNFQWYALNPSKSMTYFKQENCLHITRHSSPSFMVLMYCTSTFIIFNLIDFIWLDIEFSMLKKQYFVEKIRIFDWFAVSSGWKQKTSKGGHLEKFFSSCFFKKDPTLVFRRFNNLQQYKLLNS